MFLNVAQRAQRTLAQAFGNMPLLPDFYRGPLNHETRLRGPRFLSFATLRAMARRWQLAVDPIDIELTRRAICNA